MLVTKGRVMRLMPLIIFALVVGLLMSQVGFAHEIEEGTELYQELERLKKQQVVIQWELQEIKTLLKERGIGAAPHPKNLQLGINQEPFKGDPEAALTLIEFTDYQCPFCRKYAKQTLPDLEKEYIATGKIKYVVRDFPLQSLHRDAFQAAVAADCAGEQGQYWEMHDRLLSSSSSAYGDWGQHAKAIGLDESQFQNCLKSDQPGQGVRKDLAEGRKVGVRGTPTFFLGVSDKNNQNIKVLKVMRGAQSYSQMKHSLDQFLAEKK
jgi:protein-disulfide isomerase